MTGSHHLADELAETLKLAVPIALTQLGQIAMMTTDIALIGRFGSEAVAAASLAHTVFFVCFTFGMGLVSAVAPLAAQAFGARNPHRIRRSLRVGLWVALLIALPMMALSFRGEPILLMLGQSPVTADLAQQYLLGLTWSILPALWFLAIRGFMSAVNRPEPILWITLAADPGQCAAGLPIAVRGVRPAEPRTVRRRACDLHCQFRHAAGGAVVCRAPPSVSEISCARTSLGASTGA